MNAPGHAKRIALRRSLNITAVALGICLLWFAIAVISLSADTRAVRRADDERQVITRWRDAVQTILLSLSDAETGQRGYLLTGRERYLVPYRNAVNELPPLLSSLGDLNAALGDSSQAAAIADLQRTTPLKLDELAQSLRLADQHEYAAALALVRTDAGQELMEKLRGDIDSLTLALDAKAQDLSEAIVQRVAHRGRSAVVAGAALLLALFLAATQAGLLFAAHRRFEIALGESEQKHRALIDAQMEVIALVRADGGLAYTNPAFRRFLRQFDTSLQDLVLFDWISPLDRPSMRRALAEAFATAEAVAVETRALAVDSEEKWISWRLRLQQDGSTSPAVQAVGRDVTVRKNAEFALRASEEFLQRIGRVAGVGGWEINLNSGEPYWSSQVRRILEVANDYPLTVEAAVLLVPEDARAALRDAMDRARLRGESWDLELPLTLSSGRQIYVRTVGEVECNDGGTPHRLVGTLQDVTDRKQLELKLEANERFIRGVTDNLPVRMAYLDGERRFEFVNRTLCERMKTTREAMMGRSILEFAPPPLRDALDRLWDEVSAAGAQRYEYEDVVEGDARQIEMQLIPDRCADGRMRGMFLIGNDLTHRKRVESALRELTEVFDNTTDFVAQTDWRGQVKFINKSARRAVGIDEHASLEGYLFKDFYPPDAIEQYFREIIPTVKRTGVWVGESSVLLNRGRIVPVEHMVIGHHDAEGRVCRYSSVMRDITEKVTARKDLARQAAILNTVIEAIPAMMAVFDRDMRYLFVNQGYERWRGLARESIIGRSLENTLPREEFERCRSAVNHALDGETIYEEREYPQPAMARYMALTYTPLKLADGEIAGFFGFAQDITRHREEQVRLTLLAERDPLTGVFNRAGFEQYMDSKVNHGYSAMLAVIYIDLDRFKPINDTYGHAAGDRVLTLFASRLQHLVRPDDAVARLGGDEFAVALCGIRDIGDAGKVANKILQMSRQSFSVGEDNADSTSISASIGVARGAGAGWKDLVKRADAMAYRAKAAGRDRCVLEDEDLVVTAAAGATTAA